MLNPRIDLVRGKSACLASPSLLESVQEVENSQWMGHLKTSSEAQGCGSIMANTKHTDIASQLQYASFLHSTHP